MSKVVLAAGSVAAAVQLSMENASFLSRHPWKMPVTFLEASTFALSNYVEVSTQTEISNQVEESTQVEVCARQSFPKDKKLGIELSRGIIKGVKPDSWAGWISRKKIFV